MPIPSASAALRRAPQQARLVDDRALVAIAECTSRELLPESYRQKPREEVTRRIRELKILLSEH